MFKLIIIILTTNGVSTVLHPVTFDTLRECDTVGRMTADNLHDPNVWATLKNIAWTCTPTTADYAKIRKASQEPEGDNE